MGIGPIHQQREIQYAPDRMNLNYLIGLLCFICWIVALVDCIKNGGPNKVVWIIVIILLPFIGTILYFLFGKGKV